MNAEQKALVDAALHFAAAVPADVVERFASALLSGRSAADRTELVHRIGNPRHRFMAREFVDAWEPSCFGASEAAMALFSAAAAEQKHRREQRIELVWTGPATRSIPVRQTGEFLAALIACARRTLTLSSFGVFPVAQIGDAVRTAACRGVAVRSILGDRPNEPDRLHDRIRHLFGRELPGNVAAYCWPEENRLRTDEGNAGLMHVKCAVADGEHLFLTSANLSGNAMDLNMELGVCIHGGPTPGQVERHFDELISRGELRRVE
jgi:phosphatidylserine/phosphatidylglycerophosphate/cardiolipin synthase-like enzyme